MNDDKGTVMFVVLIVLAFIVFFMADAAIFGIWHTVEGIVREKQYRPDTDTWVIIALVEDDTIVLHVKYPVYQLIEIDQMVTITYRQSRLTGIRYQTSLVDH